MELPIPSIEKQREIVKEYNTIVNRIKLNEQLNQKLEETAQALYKHWFVDFDFPSEALAKDGVSQPYKSSGGKMVYNAELEKEIPEGWEPRRLDALGRIVDSLHKTPKYEPQGLPMVRVTDINAGFLNLSNTMLVEQNVFNEFSKNHKSQKGDIVVSRVGATFGEFSYAHTEQKFCLGQNTAVIIPTILDCKLMYTALTSSYLRNQIEQKVVGSAYSTLSLKDIRELIIILPDTDSATITKSASDKFDALFNQRSLCCQEITYLKRIQQLILSKMTKVELEQSRYRPS
jgi:type I restriction enzyme S subunit